MFPEHRLLVFLNCIFCCPCREKISFRKNKFEKIHRLLYVVAVLGLQESRHVQIFLFLRFCQTYVPGKKNLEQF